MAKPSPPPAKNGRAFLDKWTGEIIRMSVVIGISLAISYWGLSEGQQELKMKFHDICHAQQHIAENQREVLLTLVRMVDYLAYDITPDITPGKSGGDLTTREKLLQALARLPDETEC